MTLRMFRLCVLAVAWIALGSATPIRHKAPTTTQARYYWFWADSDSYYEYASVADAINDFEFATGKLVNTTQAGGTQIANGYILSTQPHQGWPDVILFTH